MSSKASSIALWTKLVSSSVRVTSNCGLLACIFFLAKGFFEETFLFCGVTFPKGGSSGGVASSPPFSSSPSSPPPCPFASSSPPSSEPKRLYPKVFSSSSLSVLDFSLLFLLLHPIGLSDMFNSCKYWASYGVSVG
jgi:hypothetical protein